MNKAPAAAQFAATSWLKSSYSAADNECVEISRVPSWVAMRDSNAFTQDRLTVSANAIAFFIGAVKDGSR
jgi:hypothetical protein